MLHRGSDVNSMMEFHSEISRYQMYSDSPTVDDLLYDMATQPIRKIGKYSSWKHLKNLDQIIIIFINNYFDTISFSLFVIRGKRWWDTV